MEDKKLNDKDLANERAEGYAKAHKKRVGTHSRPLR